MKGHGLYLLDHLVLKVSVPSITGLLMKDRPGCPHTCADHLAVSVPSITGLLMKVHGLSANEPGVSLGFSPLYNGALNEGNIPQNQFLVALHVLFQSPL